MSIEVNKELGLQFSAASLPGVQSPFRNNSLIRIDVASASIVFLNAFSTKGLNHQAGELNNIAAAVLEAGLKEINSDDFNQICRQIENLFKEASGEVAQVSQGKGGINATAVRFLTRGSNADTFYFGHIGRNRLYKFTPPNGYDLRTTDAGYMKKGELVRYDEIDRGLIWRLDRSKNERDLAFLGSNQRAELIWSNMLNPPADYLGSKDPAIQCVWNNLKPGERLLIASVGLYRSLDAGEIVEIIENAKDPAMVLAEEAKKRSAQEHFRAAPNHDYVAVVIEKLEQRKLKSRRVTFVEDSGWRIR